MKAKKLFFKETRLAGRQYHDADEVWEELKVGTLLRLEHEPNNHYDENAVQVIYERGKNEEDCFLLGYIPCTDNQEIAALLSMDWDDVFECRISKIIPEAHYEHQIRLTIRIKKNEHNSKNAAKQRE